MLEEIDLRAQTNGDGPKKAAASTTPAPSSDRWNYAWLAFIHVNQGILKGILMLAVPLITKENAATPGELAILKWVKLPEQLKLLCAPLMEYIYSPKIGKRKSWLIPCQYLLGILGLFSSFKIDEWIGHKGQESSVALLPIFLLLFFSNLLLAISDMATHTWSLSMLQRKNVGYQAACNMVGNSMGNLLGHTILILFRSKTISEFFGQQTTIISLSRYLLFWSVFFLISNTILFIFKNDTTLKMINKDEEPTSIVKSYKLIWHVLKMKSVVQLSAILLFAATGVELIRPLIQQKFIWGGMSSESIVLFDLPLSLLQATLPFLMKRHFEGSEGLERYARMLLYMVPSAVMHSVLIFFMPDLKGSDGKLTSTFYVLYLLVHGSEFMIFFLLATAYLSFVAKICDPTCGAVYLMIVHTIQSIGISWPGYLSTALLEPLTFYKGAGCMKQNDKNRCILVDGFHIFVFIGSLFNICYLYFGGHRAMMKVQNLNKDEWQLTTARREENSNTIKCESCAMAFLNFTSTTPFSTR